MIFEELQQRYGSYDAERIRQALSLDDFRLMDIEELGAYFALRSERAYQEYLTRLHQLPTVCKTAEDWQKCCSILYRRWQEADELALTIKTADDFVHSDDALAIVG